MSYIIQVHENSLKQLIIYELQKLNNYKFSSMETKKMQFNYQIIYRVQTHHNINSTESVNHTAFLMNIKLQYV